MYLKNRTSDWLSHRYFLFFLIQCIFLETPWPEFVINGSLKFAISFCNNCHYHVHVPELLQEHLVTCDSRQPGCAFLVSSPSHSPLSFTSYTYILQLWPHHWLWESVWPDVRSFPSFLLVKQYFIRREMSPDPSYTRYGHEHGCDTCYPLGMQSE